MDLQLGLALTCAWIGGMVLGYVAQSMFGASEARRRAASEGCRECLDWVQADNDAQVQALRNAQNVSG